MLTSQFSVLRGPNWKNEKDKAQHTFYRLSPHYIDFLKNILCRVSGWKRWCSQSFFKQNIFILEVMVKFVVVRGINSFRNFRTNQKYKNHIFIRIIYLLFKTTLDQLSSYKFNHRFLTKILISFSTKHTMFDWKRNLI